MGSSKTWLKIKNPKAPKKITMRKYLLSVLAIIAGAIIAAETAEVALDANGNTAKILIPKDAFTIEE
jgi:hypothetical protein